MSREGAAPATVQPNASATHAKPALATLAALATHPPVRQQFAGMGATRAAMTVF